MTRLKLLMALGLMLAGASDPGATAIVRVGPNAPRVAASREN
jgi:hypothetical protein